MHERGEVPSTVLRLAREQAGVVTRNQVLGLGMGLSAIRRLRGEGSWGTLDLGIYLVPDVEPSWLARVWAGVLLGGPGARAGGATAAFLHGLSDEEELPVLVLVPGGHRMLDRPWVCFRQERDGVRASSKTRTALPITRIEDTVLDLCDAGSETECVSWVTRAVQRRLTSPQSLKTALGRRARISHRAELTILLSDVADGIHSSLEHRYLHDVERAHHLPAGQRQQRVSGRAEYVDLLYRGQAVVVELDGRLGHLEDGGFRDRRRDNRHAVSGLLTMRFGWQEVSAQPCAIAMRVAEVLISRGWSGYPTRCDRCR